MSCVLKACSIFILTAVLCSSAVGGYKWVEIKRGEKMPELQHVIRNTIYSPARFIGRARHYDEILPAEVYNSSYAEIYSCSKVTPKYRFAVLKDTNNCSWIKINQTSQVPENAVRLGTMWNGEPSYLALTKLAGNLKIASVLLSSNQTLGWGDADKGQLVFVLACPDYNKWVDTEAANIPKHTVDGGKSSIYREIFVARLKKGCDIVPAQVVPIKNIAMGILENQVVNSSYCQVLVRDNNAYSWVSAANGEIPDNAVVSAKSKGNELMYVARINETLTYVVHSLALKNQMTYEILVKDNEE